jgi:hypothetical protein
MSYGFLHRLSETARSPVVVTNRRFPRVLRGTDIAAGWPVVDINGQGVGTVKGREADFLAVSRGFGRSRLYVPLTAVGELAKGTIRLNLATIEIDEKRWSKKPRSSH